MGVFLEKERSNLFRIKEIFVRKEKINTIGICLSEVLAEGSLREK